MNHDDKQNFDTIAVHGGELEKRLEKSIVLPIFQSSTYESVEGASYDENRYLRLNNSPNHVVLGQKIAALEKAEAAIVTSSGMSAITTAVLGLIPEGKTLLAQNDLYGGSHYFFKENLPKLGRSVDFYTFDDLDGLEKKVTPKTAGIYVESLSNPTLRIPDLEKIAKFAKAHGLVSFIDNTIPSPWNFNPCDLGFDVVLHSATKYMNGHSDIVAGAIVGKKALLGKVSKLLNILGGCLDPHACFLLHRGLKTLGVRVRHQNDSALRIASHLQTLPNVTSVIYPMLPSHPDHARAKQWFRGGSGMISFIYGKSEADAARLIEALRYPVIAPSLGGVESLITIPKRTSHSSLSPADRKTLSIPDNLIRFSVGLEDPNDLMQDFSRACEIAKVK